VVPARCRSIRSNWGSKRSVGASFCTSGVATGQACGVAVVGIVKARNSSLTQRLYACTLMKGVRIWAPSATLP
jgi:hypothetical protein